MAQAWEKEISESLTGIEPMTSRTHGGCSIHRGTRTHGEQGHLTEFINIPFGHSDISLSHAHVMLINLSFTFHYQAQNLPSSFTYYIYYCILYICYS